jgi:hypothetical protein
MATLLTLEGRREAAKQTVGSFSAIGRRVRAVRTKAKIKWLTDLEVQQQGTPEGNTSILEFFGTGASDVATNLSNTMMEEG